MQKEAKNTSSEKKILSIRLASGGLYFYIGTGRPPVGRWERQFSFAKSGNGVSDAVRKIVEDTPQLSDYFSAVMVFIDTENAVFVAGNAAGSAVTSGVGTFGSAVVRDRAVGGACLTSDDGAVQPYAASADCNIATDDDFVAGDAAQDPFNDVSEAALIAENAEEFLRRAGIFVGQDKGVALSPVVAGVRAAMVYDAGALAFLREYYGAKLSFYSPLQDCIEIAGRYSISSGGIWVNITDSNIYMFNMSAQELQTGQRKRLRLQPESDLQPQLPLMAVRPYVTDADLVFHICEFAKLSGYVRVKTVGADSTAAAGGKSVMTFGRRAPELFVMDSCGIKSSSLKFLRKYFRLVRN